MKHLKAVCKRLESLKTSGYGDYVTCSGGDGLGAGIYEMNLGRQMISIFEKGVLIKSIEENMFVLYSEILKITSHLSVVDFSKASEARSLDASIPLEIFFSGEVVVIDVPLLIYSRLLIVLNELWRKSVL